VFVIPSEAEESLDYFETTEFSYVSGNSCGYYAIREENYERERGKPNGIQRFLDFASLRSE
jgi:hypothetical protein